MSSTARHQLGQVIKRSGTFYIRYYRTDVEAGKRVGTWLSERLCETELTGSSDAAFSQQGFVWAMRYCASVLRGRGPRLRHDYGRPAWRGRAPCPRPE